MPRTRKSRIPSTSSQFEIVVTGESLWPMLVPGQRYTAQRNVEPTLGDIVVAEHPNDQSTTIVKRVSAIQNDSYTLSGMVSWSSTFVVTRPQILGVLVL